MSQHLRSTLTATAIFVTAALGFSAWGVTSPAQARVEVFLDIAPPPPVVEEVPVPRRGYVWAPGYYAYRDHGHYWVAGHYIRERRGHTWIADRWDEDHGRYRYVPGHWEERY